MVNIQRPDDQLLSEEPDVEGHRGPISPLPGIEADDTEGHISKKPVIDTDDEDDVEAHQIDGWPTMP